MATARGGRALVLAACAFAPAAAGSAQPNPPTWPSTVQVFGPEDNPADIEAVVQAAYLVNGGQVPADHGQFSSHRYAFLFRPGRYDIEVPVGYYTQVLGLGELPSDVTFTSAKGVFCEESNRNQAGGALSTFWRGAENFRTDADHSWFGMRGMLWAASQASPLRRIVVHKNLLLFQYQEGRLAGYSSGGFIANSRVDGGVHYGSQQQFFTRNCAAQRIAGGVWNLVFVGTLGARPGHCGRSGQHLPDVTVDKTPVIAEKPFVSVDDGGKYFLNIPSVGRERMGYDHDRSEKVNFKQVFVADASRDTSESINARLAEGLHVVLAPGIYELQTPLELNTPGQVLLGLGLATLVAAAGQAAVRVGDVDGVRLAGVLLQAGKAESDVLLEWGTGASPGDGTNPGFLHDVFVRVGGPAEPGDAEGPDAKGARANVMVRINSGNVVGDNLWLWRADHTALGLTVDGANPCNVGLVVNGDDVTMYGLAVEHHLQDQVQWNGDRGATYFFQSELPYDVTSEYGARGFTGYRVSESVQEHGGYGLGVYHNFRDFPVTVATGIVAPQHLEGSFVSPLTVFLNGKGKMKHILNSHGEATPSAATRRQAQWLCKGLPGRPFEPGKPSAPPFDPTKVLLPLLLLTAGLCLGGLACLQNSGHLEARCSQESDAEDGSQGEEGAGRGGLWEALQLGVRRMQEVVSHTELLGLQYLIVGRRGPVGQGEEDDSSSSSSDSSDEVLSNYDDPFETLRPGTGSRATGIGAPRTSRMSLTERIRGWLHLRERRPAVPSGRSASGSPATTRAAGKAAQGAPAGGRASSPAKRRAASPVEARGGSPASTVSPNRAVQGRSPARKGGAGSAARDQSR